MLLNYKYFRKVYYALFVIIGIIVIGTLGFMIVEGWTLLDLGCGPAENIKRNILPIMGEKDVYIGIDISKKLLVKARNNIPKGTFIRGAMENFNFKKNSADFVCFFGAK